MLLQVPTTSSWILHHHRGCGCAGAAAMIQKTVENESFVSLETVENESFGSLRQRRHKHASLDVLSCLPLLPWMVCDLQAATSLKARGATARRSVGALPTPREEQPSSRERDTRKLLPCFLTLRAPPFVSHVAQRTLR